MTSVLSRGLGDGSGKSTSFFKVTHDVDDESKVDHVETCPHGRYVRYKEVLGKGAFKTVYKAFDQIDGIEVAWNRMKINKVLESEKDLQKLYSEVHLLGHLNHENIMKYYDSWVDEKQKTFNMITELFTSGSLRQYRKKYKTVDTRAIKNWARQILRGLDHLHSQNPPIIHRDLKCDNIFVNGNQGQIKIGDLGLATILQKPTAKSVTGTPEFMAPELYEEEYNELVDIYSFGMCLLEMVTLEYPYSECENQAQIFRKVTLGVKPASLGKVATSEVKEFIKKCLLPASERFSARELLKDPFLRPEKSKSPICDEVQIPHEVPSFLGPTDCDVHSSDTDHDYSQFANTDSNSGSPRSSMLEFQRMHQNNEFRLKGTRNGDKISLIFRIADQSGKVENISFQFDPHSDTAVSVASEMVNVLELADLDVAFIAEFIDFLLIKILPDWKPSSDYKCNMQTNDSQVDLMVEQGGACASVFDDNGLQICLPSNNGGSSCGNSGFVSAYEAFSSSPCLTSYGNLSQESMAYEIMRTGCFMKNTISSRSDGDISEFDLCKLFHEECRVHSAGSSQVDQLSEFPGLNIHDTNTVWTIGSQTSDHLISTLQGSDSLRELKLQLDAIEAQYQQQMQELSRRKIEEMEATKRRWMTKNNVVVH